MSCYDQQTQRTSRSKNDRAGTKIQRGTILLIKVGRRDPANTPVEETTTLVATLRLLRPEAPNVTTGQIDPTTMVQSTTRDAPQEPSQETKAREGADRLLFMAVATLGEAALECSRSG